MLLKWQIVCLAVPIVGFYNEAKEDFEEHNRVIDISNGEFKIKDTTRPYGFPLI